MNYIEVKDYYSTLNLAIELFEKMGLPKHHFDRIHKLSELVESAYNGFLPLEFCRNHDETIGEEEFFSGMLLDDSGDHSPNPSYNILEQAKQKQAS